MDTKFNTRIDGMTTHKSQTEPNIWKEDYIVRSYEIDANGNLSVASIFNLMQNAASNHAHSLGVSVRQLLASNHSWVLSRMLLKIDAYPRWKDRIQVHTWPSGVKGLFALRDFDIKDQYNHTFGACISAWLIIDINKRRPVRISPFVQRLNPIDGKHVLTEKLEKLPNGKSSGFEQRFRVGFRDIDLNQHVNSARYIEWALESVPESILNTMVLRSLQIDFVAETFFADSVVASCRHVDGKDTVLFHHIRKEDTGQELARAQTVWADV